MRMRPGVLGLALATGALAVGSLAAQDAKRSEERWTGWITDSTCGARNASEKGKACILDCVKNRGAKLVLYVEDGEKTFDLDDQKKAGKHVGYPVRVTGVLEGSTIQVKKIEERDPKPREPQPPHGGFGSGGHHGGHVH